jgi:ornithine carbamoyltransferase
MAIQFTRNGRKAILWAQVEAMRRGETLVEREHLLLGLLHGDSNGAVRILSRLGYAADDLRLAAVRLLRPESASLRVDSAQLAPASRKTVEQAQREIEITGHDFVGTEHLLLALLRESASLGVLSAAGVTYAAAAAVLADGFAETPEEDSSTPTPIADAASVPALAPRTGFLKGRHILAVDDLTDSELAGVFALTREIKLGRVSKAATGKTAALLFEKPSLRTKVTFMVAMTRLGGESIFLGRDEVGLGTREAVRDVARGLSRWVDTAIVRTFDHRIVTELAAHSTIPIINALTDAEHPCQAFADFYTIREHRADTRGQKLVFIGDGNNVAISLMLLAPRMGTHFTLACPPGFEPPEDILARTQALASQYGTNFEIVHDPVAASDDADVLYTDVWTSMGQEEETARRQAAFAPFQIGPKTLREAKDDVLVLHCLPAHRGDEITDDAMDGPFSKVFDQAENRLHVQQALLASVL